MNKRNLKKKLRAQWRDALVLLQESSSTLTLFALLVIGSALLFYFFYTDPNSGDRIDFTQAVYGAFALLFFQESLAFPSQGFLRLLYFIIPIFGLVVVAEGVIRFGVALTNKKERGQKWQVAMASTYRDHIIVCGLGKVGFRVVQELIKLDMDVVAIEIDPNGRFIEKTKNLEIPVIIADARRTENLVKAGVELAAAVIPCTDDELTNLDIALDAREVNPAAKIVMRLYDPDLARRVESGFGIHTAYSTSALAAPVFAAASMKVNIKSSFYVGDTLLNISEICIQPGADIEGWDVAKLESSMNLSVISYLGSEEPLLHPESGQILEAGSKILVLASLETLHRLEGMNRT